MLTTGLVHKGQSLGELPHEDSSLRLRVRALGYKMLKKFTAFD